MDVVFVAGIIVAFLLVLGLIVTVFERWGR